MRKLAIFSAAFTIAAALYVYVAADARALLLAGACLLLSLLLRFVGGERCSIFLLGAAVALLWSFGYESVFLERVAVGQEQQTVTVQVSDLPRQTKYGMSVYVDLGGYGAVMYGDESLSELRPGDTVRCIARVERSNGSFRDGESLYLRSKGILYCINDLSQLQVEAGQPPWSQQLRQWLQDRIGSLYDESAASFLRAILTGDRSGLSNQVQSRMSVAGISHTIAVSGMHVSVLLTLVAFLCGKNPRLAALFGIPIVLGFVLVTGASASVCRAAVMQVLLLAAPLVGREHDSPTALGTAALILLLQNPWAVADVSFQLSFAAVLGLILFAKPVEEKLLSAGKRKNILFRFAASGIGATLGATVLTLPLTVLYFRMISIASVMVNILCLWAVTAVFSLGLLSCLTGGLGTVFVWPVTVLIKYILGLCTVVSRFPFAAAYPENPSLMVWAVVAYTVGLAVLLSRRKLSAGWLAGGLAVAFVVCIFAGNKTLQKGDMTFTAVDVGQGQCLILNTEGFTAMIDCGGSDADDAGEAAVRVLHSAGITRVDALVLTHFDADHTGGISQLLGRVTVDRIFAPAHDDDKRKLLEKEIGVPVAAVAENTKIEFSEGYLLLMPADSAAKGNDTSLCVLAKAAEYDILITGDRTAEGELRLLNSCPIPEVDLLVAGHHGSETSTSKLLLEHTKPKKVLISVEENSAYGHPSPVILQRISDAGAEVLRTDKQGTIFITE